MPSSLAPAPTARTASRYIRRAAVTTGEDLRYDVSDRIAEISLARPPVNELSLSLLEQLIAALRRAAAMRLGRAAFMRVNDLDYRRGIGEAVENFCDVAATADAQEGVRAFIEKRSPNW